jgi:rhodanese-related sulfurtransferase
MAADLTVREVAALRERDGDGDGDGEAIELIDVREQHEWDAGRIAGARHIPLGDLPAAAETIARERTVIFYCRTGVRSAMATEAFAAAGFDAHNMAGGLKSWTEAGLPLDPADGHVV